jgi:sugar/nucleoside kinase (ribokinase family)
MRKIDVICIGNSAVDVPLCPIDKKIFTTDSYPIDRIIPMIGGSGTNVSTILSRLEISTRLITMLGEDFLGDYIIDHCIKSGIDSSHIIRSSDVDTPLSIGIVKADGERNFIVSKSSSTFHFSPADINLKSFDGAKLLTIASLFIMPKFNADGLCQLFQKAKQEGLIICTDMMRSRTGEKLNSISRALHYVDYFFANYEEASFLTGLENQSCIADKILATGVKNVIIKNGKHGCYIKGANIEEKLPAYINPKPVDTIGAGDNFVAGFIYGLLNGLSLIECANFANATAAISVSAGGATTGVRSKQQVFDFITNYE